MSLNVNIITCGSMNRVCKEEAQRTTAEFGMHSSRWSYGNELIPSPTNLGYARQVMQILNCHTTGPQDFKSSCPNQRKWRVQNGIAHWVQAVRVLIHPVLVDKWMPCVWTVSYWLLTAFNDHYTVCYLADIQISSTKQKDHAEPVWKVLERLQEFDLYGNAAKSHFGVMEVCVHRFVISPEWC